MDKNNQNPNSGPTGAPAQKIDWVETMKMREPTKAVKQRLLFNFIGRFIGDLAKDEEIDLLRKVFALIDEHEALFR